MKYEELEPFMILVNKLTLEDRLLWYETGIDYRCESVGVLFTLDTRGSDVVLKIKDNQSVIFSITSGYTYMINTLKNNVKKNVERGSETRLREVMSCLRGEKSVTISDLEVNREI